MPTYHARLTYTYAGTNNFAVTFPFISQDHVEVFVNGTETTDITWLTDTTFSIDDPALVNGDTIVIRRRTSPDEQVVDFEGDSVIREDDLDNALTQMFYMAQEAMDRAEQAFDAAGGSGP